MNTPDVPTSQPTYWRNWLSFAGAVVAIGSFFAFLLLFAMEIFARNKNPYMGILAFVVAPIFLFMGLGMMAIGAWVSIRLMRWLRLPECPYIFFKRAAIVLTVYEGMNHAEAARILGCSETTVSWRLFAARAKLRRLLKTSHD